ncbi:uncharacterized protein LOC110731502 [Chenopodium quinoa]|uniref:uncharacterized protein LOC110731502 n=1 Tax=Chenopodium quinoa TaxID=63459 RepID=UPI000B77AC26|nr:uncharacterized protein LOC110731502 [Chenopodium quinoa]
MSNDRPVLVWMIFNHQSLALLAPHPVPSFVSWSPPPVRFCKLNFDGSAPNNLSMAGVVLRDDLDNHIPSRTYNLGSCPAFLAIVIALRNGLLLARAHNISHIFIEGDNLMVINILQGHFKCPWKLHLLMNDIKKILESFSTFHSHHIYREGN